MVEVKQSEFNSHKSELIREIERDNPYEMYSEDYLYYSVIEQLAEIYDCKLNEIKIIND